MSVITLGNHCSVIIYKLKKIFEELYIKNKRNSKIIQLDFTDVDISVLTEGVVIDSSEIFLGSET